MFRYAIAIIIGLIVYMVLRQLLGPEIMLLASLVVLVVAGLIVFGNLRNNRKIADAAPEARARALAFTPEPDKAALYLLRRRFIGKAVGVNIEIDGKQVTQLKSPRFTRVTLYPGVRRINAFLGAPERKKPGEAAFDYRAEPGAITVLELELEPQMVGVKIKLTPVDLDGTRAAIEKARMTGADLSDL